MVLRPKLVGELAAQVFDTPVPTAQKDEQYPHQKRFLDDAKAALTKAFLEGGEQAQQRVMEALEREGDRLGSVESYVKDLRYRRKRYDSAFKRPFDELIKVNALNKDDLNARLEKLKVPVYDIEHLSAEERERLREDFPGGNFLYHGAKGEVLLKILETGVLKNVVGLREEEKLAAEKAGRDPQFIRTNSGFEGISWNLNKVDALFGDRYHLAGLLGSPQTVLHQDEQLVIPSRPSPYEVVQISRAVDANTFYPLKNQLEAYSQVGLFTINSVLEELTFLCIVERGRGKDFSEQPVRIFFDTYTDQEVESKIQGRYTIRPDQTIELHPDTRSQISLGRVPLLAIWLHGLLVTGRLQVLPGFEHVRTVREAVLRITKDTYVPLARELGREIHPHKERMKIFSFEAIQVPVKNLYLIVARQDLDYWRAALVCMKTMPKGILVYDGSRVRLENTATAFEGDHVIFTHILRTALPPANVGYIDWEQDLLGQKMTPHLRSGHARQLVKESAIQQRKFLIKAHDGLLIVDGSSH